MTFGEAQAILRNDVLAESSTDYYTDADLLGFLVRSAKELAMMFGFPTAIGSAAISALDYQFALPADAEQVDLNEVEFNGFRLEVAPFSKVFAFVTQVGVGNPRYYNYDPRRGGNVLFAPAASVAGTVSFEYVQKYDTSALTTASDIWDGLFPAYHELVVFRAGVKAFDASLENDRAGYWQQKEQKLAQEFSAFLNKLPLNRLAAPEVVES